MTYVPENPGDSVKPEWLMRELHRIESEMSVGGAGSSVIISDTPPLNPEEGDQWFDSKRGLLCVWYNDADGSQWVSDPYWSQLIGLAFTQLTDTPATYSGNEGKLVKVNATADGLIFGDPSGSSVSWGDILGTLANQTDLQNALDGKANSVHYHSFLQLVDTLSSYVGMSGKLVSVNSTEDGLVFTDPVGGSSITVSDTPPADPSQGDAWFDSKLGIPAIWYEDGDSGQWVSSPYQAQDAGDVMATVIVSDTPPPAPVNGMRWLDSKTGWLATWYVDADGGQWISATPVAEEA